MFGSKAFIKIEKKSVKQSLPLDFFERVCDLELQLAKEFNMDTLQELVKLFKVYSSNSECNRIL
jgi:hypothetical protein